MIAQRQRLEKTKAAGGTLRKALYTLLRVTARVLERASRAFVYLAAGTLRLHELRQAIADTWEDLGREEGYILSGLMVWEKAFYGRFLKPADRILLVGCGTGRDLIALLKLGYRVEGLDVAPGAIGLARHILEKEGLRSELYTGPIEAVALRGNFDAVVFSLYSYGLIPHSETRVGVLRKVMAHLNPGGRILISYNPADQRPRSLPIRLTRLLARLTRSDWHVELGDVIDAAANDWRRILYEHRFQNGELETEARAAGLAIVFDERGKEGTAVLTAESRSGADEPVRGR
jgi:2-polyprenyl-3-methyl-5-hydroxy-6-metoxy-1,4-benzoquinol methylase